MDAAPTQEAERWPAGERLSAIVDGIGEIVWAVDRSWRLTVFNAAAEDFFGCSRAAVLDRPLWEVFAALNDSELETRYRRVMKERRPELFEAQSVSRPDRCLEIRAFPTPEGIAVTSRDVTDRRSAEEALRRNEEKLRVALSAARLGAWERDLTTGVLTATDTCKANVGLAPEAPLTFEMLQAMRHPDDVERVTQAIQRAIREGAEYDVEYRIMWPDQSVHWIMARGHAVYDEKGAPIRMVGVTLDITERRATEESLRESDLLKGAILETALDCIITISADSRVAEWNPAAERTFGYSREEALGQDLAELIIPPHYRDRHRQGMARYLATGVGPVLGRRIELEGQRSDGSSFPVELAIVPIEIAAQRRFTAHLRDISDRKAAEAALRESEQRIRVTYEHAFAGIAETDETGRFLRVNEQFTFITGYSREELLQLTFQELTHPDDREHDLDQYRRQWTGDIDAYVVEKRYLHKDGHEVWVKLSASIVRDAAGRTLYGVRVVDNISDRKTGERHQRLLVDELNHRVKNTLAVVRAIASQTLKDGDVPLDIRENFEARLLALANAHDILTRENWEGAELETLVQSALRPLDRRQGSHFQIGGPNLRIRPKTAVALTLALHELGTNATKYGALSSPTGTVEVCWAVLTGNKEDRFRMVWRERGGPTVAAPARAGFGSRLIERGLPAELQGEVQMDFDPAGLVCSIESPLHLIQEEPG